MINRTVFLNGFKIYPFTSDIELLDYIRENKGILVAINAEKILHATEETRTIINRNIGYCDGIGAVMAMKKKGYKSVVKLPGCELWLKIISSFYKEGKTFYLIGGKEQVINNTISKLKIDFPGINILNYRNGYIQNQAEREALIHDVANRKPDVVFVAMGSPKQEIIMEEMFQQHIAVYQGLGGSFDVYTGHVKRAPAWWVHHGLEWAYRLIKQPTRLKRQLSLLRFLWLLEIGKI